MDIRTEFDEQFDHSEMTKLWGEEKWVVSVLFLSPHTLYCVCLCSVVLCVTVSVLCCVRLCCACTIKNFFLSPRNKTIFFIAPQRRHYNVHTRTHHFSLLFLSQNKNLLWTAFLLFLLFVSWCVCVCVFFPLALSPSAKKNNFFNFYAGEFLKNLWPRTQAVSDSNAVRFTTTLLVIKIFFFVQKFKKKTNVVAMVDSCFRFIREQNMHHLFIAQSWCQHEWRFSILLFFFIFGWGRYSWTLKKKQFVVSSYFTGGCSEFRSGNELSVCCVSQRVFFMLFQSFNNV